MAIITNFFIISPGKFNPTQIVLFGNLLKLELFLPQCCLPIACKELTESPRFNVGLSIHMNDIHSDMIQGIMMTYNLSNI